MHSPDSIKEILSQRPMVLKNDVGGLILLGIRFGFLSGDEKNLVVTQHGRHFMNYVDSTAEKISQISNPAEENYSSLDKIIKDIEEKYKEKDSGIFTDIVAIRKAVSEKIIFSPELPDESETLLTVSMPPTGGDKIPSKLRGVVFHNDAIKYVIQNAANELFVTTYTLDVPQFRTSLANINTKRLVCKIIVGNDKKLREEKDYPYSIDALKKFLEGHFESYEVRVVKDLSKDYVSHAKIWLSEKAVLITSANIAFNSNVDNFEAGVYSTQKELINSCSEVLKKIWNLGVPL